MATMLNPFTRRAVCSLRSPSLSSSALRQVQKRTLHASSVVMKKKNKSDALFVDHISHTTTKQDGVEEVDDLFADVAPPTPQSTTSLSEAKSRSNALESTIPGRTRTERFHTALLDFHKTLGKDILNPPRRRTFVTLLQLADTKDDLEKIIRLFPLYKITYAAQRIDGGKLGEEVVEAFIHRCTQLGATDLALQILGDYAKYRVNLTLPSARTLLHTLSKTVPPPLQNVALLTSLYTHYNLGPITADLPSLALLTSVLLSANSKTREEAKRELIPKLLVLLNKQGSVPVPENKASEKEKWKVWLKGAMKRIEKQLQMKEKLKTVQ